MKKPLLIGLLAATAWGIAAHGPTGRKEPRRPYEDSPASRLLALARRMVEAINAGDDQGIRRDFAQAMNEAMPPEKSVPFFEQLLNQYGRILELESPHLAAPDQAVIPARCERGTIDIRLVLNAEDKITGLWFMPHRPRLPVPEEHKTPLRLPFRGPWLVHWGGDTREQNYHHDTPNQRFAFDFVGADRLGNTHKPRALANEDYFAFGREILAPGPGTVTDVIRGVRDNRPGSMNPYSALGNAVFIRHRRNEVSVLAHLKQGTIRVKVGDKVKAGDVVGLCGNSGNSSEPHLHYQLQNTEVIQDAVGIKCYFENVRVLENGTEPNKGRYSPVKGDIVIGPE